MEEIQNVTVIELKKNWKGIEKEKREKSLNRKGEKSKKKRKIKVQIEKGYKSPNINWKK